MHMYIKKCPAPAGMIPSFGGVRVGWVQVPRTCGDDPFFGKLRKCGVDPDDFDSVVVKLVQENSERIDFIVSNTGELVGFESVPHLRG